MARRCMHTPCRDPQADARIVWYCDVCDGEIYEGEPCYRFDHFTVCDDCAFRALTTAEAEDGE